MSETFLIITIIQRNIIHVRMSSYKVPVVFEIFYSNFNFFETSSKSPHIYIYILNFINILRLGDDLFHVDRQTEKQEDPRTDKCSNRHKETNDRFSKLSSTPKEVGILAQALRSIRPRAGRLRDHSRIARIWSSFCLLVFWKRDRGQYYTGLGGNICSYHSIGIYSDLWKAMTAQLVRSLTRLCCQKGQIFSVTHPASNRTWNVGSVPREKHSGVKPTNNSKVQHQGLVQPYVLVTSNFSIITKVE
jgi:hypothetical protein